MHNSRTTENGKMSKIELGLPSTFPDHVFKFQIICAKGT
jgi:hypothetical protein